ncbi:YihY/virulence factor BrkB family protein [Nocardioides aestuarii]|uniref:YihY/virulence factor BrkB family protein n=1 Tax=Nocardioides aestuarii TaxID=252231 RepID=A0ABW4TLP9_9ACTN
MRSLVERLPGPVRAGVELAERATRDAVADRVPGLAAEATLFVLISLPALLLVVLGSLGFVAARLGPAGQEELDRLVYDVPRTFLSSTTYESYADIVAQVLDAGRVDVIGIGAVLALWTGSRATSRVLETLVIVYDIESPRPGWRRRLLALGLTAGALLAAVALLPLLVLGPRLVEYVAPDTIATATLTAFGWAYWPALGALVLAGLTTLFHVGVPWHTPWRRDLPGAVLAMVVWLVAAAALRVYLALSVLGGDEAVYGQLGTPIAVVLWLYVSSIAVLLGAELNAEIEKRWPTIERAEQQAAVDQHTG